MEKIASSFISEYEFIKDANDDIISAVFPMHQHLKKENNKRMILGGSVETGESRFAELGIPAGLYLEPNCFSFNNVENINTNKSSNSMLIDEQLFDKLLGTVSSVKPYSGTRRKYYKPKNSKTKKQ
jgi:hypothetical protein